MKNEEITGQIELLKLRGKVKIDYARDYTLLFNATVHKNASRFVIPKFVRANFDWTSMSEVGLVIFSKAGECRFCGVQTLKSGPEVYGIDMKCLVPGEEIYVHAFQPPPRSCR